MAKIPTKKVKVQVRACQTSICSAKLQQKVKAWQTLNWFFTFLVGIFAIFGKISNFSLLGGTSSILRTFLGGTSQKNHPVGAFGEVWGKYCDSNSFRKLLTLLLQSSMSEILIINNNGEKVEFHWKCLGLLSDNICCDVWSVFLLLEIHSRLPWQLGPSGTSVSC